MTIGKYSTTGKQIIISGKIYMSHLNYLGNVQLVTLIGLTGTFAERKPTWYGHLFGWISV